MEKVYQVTNPPTDRAILIYDLDCSFCRRWIIRLQSWVGEKLDYAPFQQAKDVYTEIPLQQFQHAVQLIEPDGSVYSGAEAIFRALAKSPEWSWYLWLYRYLPGFSSISEWFYNIVARHRSAFDKLMTWLWGRSQEPATFFLTRWIFLRGLALVYLVAFISFWIQMEGLIGSNGILPANEYLASTTDMGIERFYYLPTLYWMNTSDAMLHFLCASGVIASMLLLMSFIPILSLIWLWLSYLSLLTVGQEFLQYQWDTLLLEIGFLAIFFAPSDLWTRLTSVRKPPRIILFLLWFLLFRLMFSSGYVKLASEDPVWANLTALKYHFETQPLPTWIAWYAHQLPLGILKLAALIMFAIELVIPFLIFTPRRSRFLAAILLIFLQVLIILTGNYGFFNYLAILLTLTLIDDVYWQKILPSRLTQRLTNIHQRPREQTWWRGVSYAAFVVLLLLGSIQLLRTLEHMPDFLSPLLRTVSPFRSVNTYGLFAVMTQDRPEIILEGSMDGNLWISYDFRWKPDEIFERPCFVAPHQPRLDWQMWFAALGNYRQNVWLLKMMEKIMLGEPKVIALLGENPFSGTPPIYMRAVIYDYNFTTLYEAESKVNYWKREPRGLYCPIVTLKSN